MTPSIILALTSHVFLGLAGTISAYISWRELLRPAPRLSWLSRSSLATPLLWLAAWLSGGYYYVHYYGDNVKPVIKAGAYAWAHGIVMEAKEHVFILLPFLAVLLWVIVRQSDQPIITHRVLQRAAARLSAVTVALSVLMAAAGVLISGAVR